MNMGKQIAVLDRGFVYVGKVAIAEGFVTISDAQCVRRWGTSHGLGQLAGEGPQPNTKLDPTGTVTAPLGSLVHLITCEPSAWTK